MNLIPVIISTKAGRSISLDQKIQSWLGPKFVFCSTQNKHDAAQLFLEQLKKGEKLVLIAGGDTTFDEIIDGAMKNVPESTEAAIGIISKGSAENAATNIGMNKLFEVCCFYRTVANQRLKLEDFLKKVDLIKVSFDDNKVQYGLSSFNIGMVSHVAYGVESDGYSFPESFFKRHRRKVMAYAAKAFKAAITYKPFKVKLTYNLADGTTESYTLENILDINVVNGKKHGAIPDWNPYGSPFDGVMEVCGYDNPKLFHIIKLITKMLVSRHYSHLNTKKQESGYNVHGIHYERDVKSFEIRILDKGRKGPLYVELGSATWPIEKPEAVIKAEIVPGALNFVYMNHHPLLQKA